VSHNDREQRVPSAFANLPRVSTLGVVDEGVYLILDKLTMLIRPKNESYGQKRISI
jgi:hypothetical protein